jgi:hypothetical protein
MDKEVSNIHQSMCHENLHWCITVFLKICFLEFIYFLAFKTEKIDTNFKNSLTCFSMWNIISLPCTYRFVMKNGFRTWTFNSHTSLKILVTHNPYLTFKKMYWHHKQELSIPCLRPSNMSKCSVTYSVTVQCHSCRNIFSLKNSTSFAFLGFLVFLVWQCDICRLSNMYFWHFKDFWSFWCDSDSHLSLMLFLCFLHFFFWQHFGCLFDILSSDVARSGDLSFSEQALAAAVVSQDTEA